MSADDPEAYHSKLTRAEFEAIVAIEAMMSRGCEGMFTSEGGELPEALAEAMEDAGLLSSQWMEAHPDHPGDHPDGGHSYWPTDNGRFSRGMCVVGEMHGRQIIFADEVEPPPGWELRSTGGDEYPWVCEAAEGGYTTACSVSKSVAIEVAWSIHRACQTDREDS